MKVQGDASKYHGPTYLLTDGQTDGLTWVGARGSCVSKNDDKVEEGLCVCTCSQAVKIHI